MKKKLSVDLFSLIMVLYFILIIINDSICFLFKINMHILIYIISFFITFLLLYLLRKKIKIEKISFTKLDLLSITIIIIVLLARLPIPDSSFDTLNYHIYLQERLFSNNVINNFFPARWINTFSLPLGDRAHYLFRIILGYRLGLLLNTIIMIWIYFQTKRILKIFIKKSKNTIPIISCVTIITEQLLSNMVTYYIDLMSIPFFLEIIILLLDKKEKDNKTNYYVLFIAGIIISLKISNSFLLLPLAIIYIIRNKNSINIKTFIFGIPLLFLPVIVYMINNYIQTGNPVFPFYNSIFKSNYYPNSNWIETFYGPKTFKEKILWPIYILKHPRRAFDNNLYYGRISFGYITSIVILIECLFKKIIRKEKITDYHKLAIMYIILCLIWSSFMMGYIRYALILEVLSGIIIGVYIYYNFSNKNIILFITSMLAILTFARTTVLSLKDLVYGSTELSWRESYYLNPKQYNKNKKYIFQRKNKYDKYMKNIDCLGVLDYNSGYAAMLSNKTRIINLNEGYINETGKKQFEKALNKCENIYTISTSSRINNTEIFVKSAGWKRYDKKSIVFKTDFLDIEDNLVLFRIIKIKANSNSSTQRK